MMLTRSLIASTLFAGATAFGVQQSVVPEPLPASRYDKMIESSPFSVATAAAPVAEPVASFSANLFVAAIARGIRDVDGTDKDLVTIKMRGENTSFSLFGSEPNKDGITLSGIEWSDHVGKSKVTVKKGTEFATLEFDQANTHGPAAPPRPVGAPGAPRQVGPGGGVPLPNGNPGINVVRPQNRGQVQVPRPGAPPVMNQPNPPQPPGIQPQVNMAPAAPGDTRRRVRVINSKL